MSDFTNESGGGEPDPTSELPATPPAPPAAGVAESPAAPGPDRPWWQAEGPGQGGPGGAGTGGVGPGPARPGPAPGGPDPTWPGHPGPGHPGQGGGYGGPGGYVQPPGAGQWPGAATGGGGWGWVPPGGGWGSPAPGSASGRSLAQRRRSLARAGAALATAVAVLVGVAIGYSVWSPGSSTSPSSSTTPLSPTTRHAFGTATTSASSSKTSTASGGPSESAISSIASKVDPTLVDINTVLGDETAEAAGTGMVLTSTGKVLTNNHVIEGATSISVTDLGNSTTYTASVIGYDRTLDIAVIQLKGASGLQTANFGNSSNVSVGEQVVGIGNAGGTGGTPSTAGGSVTALNQAITASDEGSDTTEHLTGLIESNCDIQPGDSGGPLVTTAGQIVGMDTAASAAQGFSFSGAATGQGYSIPINTALSTAKLIEAGKSSTSVHLGETAFLGVEVESTSAATRYGFESRTPTATPSTTGAKSTATGTGALVAGVLSGTPAQSAGITKGDVITSLGGTAVTSPGALTKAIEQYHPGDTVKVVWTTTSGQSQSATVQLVNGPAG
jgi:S1-C subfamily serine protease